MSDQSAPNRVTLAIVDGKIATVDAKVDGLAQLIGAGQESTRTLLAPLARTPEDVATLKAEVAALEEGMGATASKDEHDALVQRVADLEGHRNLALNWKAMAAISLTATLLGGVLGHIAHL